MIIAEIGLNHMGAAAYAEHYVNQLLKTSVDAITFQIREPDFYLRKERKDLTLDTELYHKLSNKIKSQGKSFGLALSDISLLSALDKSVDFYKILSKDFNNEFIKEFLEATEKPIFISTGLNSLESIRLLTEKTTPEDNARISLIHTQLSHDVSDVNLSSILKLKDITCNSVSFGNHCEDFRVCFMSLPYNPHSIFVYVKGNENLEYPDNKHALQLSDFGIFCEDMKNLRSAIGDGDKKEMTNQIRGQK
jgi:sialic acid synthase SpsE